MPQPEPLSKSAETSLVPVQSRSLTAQIVNSEPNSRLYLFNQQPAVKKQEIHTPTADKKRTPVQASTKKEINKNRVHPIKKLSRKFRKNGLNIIDADFNSRFFYYIWKIDKNKGKGKYAAFIALMTVAAKLYGAVADLLAPALAFIGWLFRPEPARGKKHPAVRASEWLMPAGAVAFAALAIINISAYKPELELWINGEKVGLVASREVVSGAAGRSELNISAILGDSYEFMGTISYKMSLVKEPDYITEKQVYDLLYGYSQNYIMSAYGLYIDGALIGVTTDDSYIDEVLNIVLEEVAAEDEIVEFANDIQVIRRDYAASEVLSGEDFMTIAKYSATAAVEESFSEPEEKTAPVDFESRPDEEPEQAEESGADIASVAAAAKLSAESVNTLPRGGINSLIEANDSSLIAKLVKSSANASGMQIKRTRQESDFIEVPFETQRVNSSQHYAGTEIVQTPGANGVSKITAEVSLIGDEEISREIIDNEVITPPVARVILVGTKVKPTTNPSGSFIRPVRGGRETTQFSAGHRALDIAAPFGTVISAADGGTVIYAGFSGSYGNHVKIRHGNNYVTLYAHMSSMSVRQGDQVFKGQEIGRVGSTGRSTGNHVHFEIIRNGIQVNPKQYIN